MSEEFSRTENLIGKKAMEKLKKSRVAVFGIGGVGGHTAEALVRSGVGTIDVIDSDKVSLSNINRQIIALHSTVGELKVDAFEKRAKDINPSVSVNKYPLFFGPNNSDIINFKNYDYIVDAIDSVKGKIEVVLKANEASVPVISSMGAGNKMDPTAFRVADIYKTKVCPLARVMRYELKKRGIRKLKTVYSEETPRDPKTIENGKPVPSSNAFVPSVAGLIIASEVVKDIIKDI